MTARRQYELEVNSSLNGDLNNISERNSVEDLTPSDILRIAMDVYIYGAGNGEAFSGGSAAISSLTASMTERLQNRESIQKKEEESSKLKTGKARADKTTAKAAAPEQVQSIREPAASVKVSSPPPVIEEKKPSASPAPAADGSPSHSMVMPLLTDAVFEEEDEEDSGEYYEEDFDLVSLAMDIFNKSLKDVKPKKPKPQPSQQSQPSQLSQPQQPPAAEVKPAVAEAPLEEISPSVMESLATEMESAVIETPVDFDLPLHLRNDIEYSKPSTSKQSEFTLSPMSGSSSQYDLSPMAQAPSSFWEDLYPGMELPEEVKKPQLVETPLETPVEITPETKPSSSEEPEKAVIQEDTSSSPNESQAPSLYSFLDDFSSEEKPVLLKPKDSIKSAVESKKPANIPPVVLPIWENSKSKQEDLVSGISETLEPVSGEKPLAEKPPTEKPSLEKPLAEKLPEVKPSLEKPLAEKLPEVKPSLENPLAEKPPEEALVVKESAKTVVETEEDFDEDFSLDDIDIPATAPDVEDNEQCIGDSEEDSFDDFSLDEMDLPLTAPDVGDDIAARATNVLSKEEDFSGHRSSVASPQGDYLPPTEFLDKKRVSRQKSLSKAKGREETSPAEDSSTPSLSDPISGANDNNNKKTKMVFAKKDLLAIVDEDEDLTDLGKVEHVNIEVPDKSSKSAKKTSSPLDENGHYVDDLIAFPDSLDDLLDQYSVFAQTKAPKTGKLSPDAFVMRSAQPFGEPSPKEISASSSKTDAPKKTAPEVSAEPVKPVETYLPAKADERAAETSIPEDFIPEDMESTESQGQMESAEITGDISDILDAFDGVEDDEVFDLPQTDAHIKSYEESASIDSTNDIEIEKTKTVKEETPLIPPASSHKIKPAEEKPVKAESEVKEEPAVYFEDYFAVSSETPSPDEYSSKDKSSLSSDVSQDDSSMIRDGVDMSMFLGDLFEDVEETLQAGSAPIEVKQVSPEVSAVPPAAEADIFSPDDWMDIMDGGVPKPSSGEGDSAAGSPVITADGLGYSLKEAPDYNAKHVVPERHAPRQVEEKAPTKKGLRKKGMFSETKLSFKQRFGASKKNTARICASCGKGEKANACVSCGKAGAAIMARLCDKCSADKKASTSCTLCGRPNAKVLAKVCDRCQNTSNACAKCGGRL